ncbi:xanthine dehydrogenase family protein molybdopterin-binding subunit [Capilliphycus salinus ALCB114379]|uniref:xanthine dehydrogenase family protein molybdopterin-binding subunit n=1 Tax=Capilliphycus salinus TaxID=2768948 RepID=UPI0039A53CB4
MNKVIGTAVNRKDGLAKVTGKATYAAEHQIPGLVHGYLITSAIANGRIRLISTEAAEKAPGVIAVITHKNAPQIFKPTNNFISSKIYETRLPLADEQIHYAGQIVGLVVADTFERARDAAHLVRVEYDLETPLIDPSKATYKPAVSLFGQKMEFRFGEFSAGTEETDSSGASLEATYTTSTELHTPMEPHAIIAHWQGDSLTVYEASQWVMGTQRTYAELFGIPSEKVRIVTPYIGGAFGSKAFPWPHGVLCSAVARQIQRPLKVVVSRRQMTANTGHRSETEQTVRLTAALDGKLAGIVHTAKSATSPVEEFAEPCTTITPAMYAAPNIQTSQTIATLNVGTPIFMRAPGEAPGMWAMESAMDELAWKLNLDPVELRLKNETQTHLQNNLPFSSKHFADCLQEGARRFGWQNRPPQLRTLASDGQLIGWGMAASTFPALRGNASAKVRLLPDGRVNVLTAANDIGTGTYTMVAITAAETLGVSVDRVKVEIGDSLFPDGGIAGGSRMTASLAPAVQQACQNLLKSGNFATTAEALKELQQCGRAALEATGSSAPSREGKQWAFQSWGAHFCEVTVDEELGRLRVTRWVSAMDIGRVMNAKAAASQIRGGIIMGIGEALMEECLFDPNTGHPVVYDLATYHYPCHADVPRIDVTFVGKPDLEFNPLGVRGAGEIGITGVAAAIANAVYHATGRRLRSLPLTPDKLIAQF